MSSNVMLPPLVAPTAPVNESPQPRVSLMAVAALVALTFAAVAIGWGFTQWSSAGDWRHRSETMEAQFDKLEARTERAERKVVVAQHATKNASKRLTEADTQLTSLANQNAFDKDIKAVFCDARPDLLPPDMQARICS